MAVEIFVRLLRKVFEIIEKHPKFAFLVSLGLLLAMYLKYLQNYFVAIAHK